MTVSFDDLSAEEAMDMMVERLARTGVSYGGGVARWERFTREWQHQLRVNARRDLTAAGVPELLAERDRMRDLVTGLAFPIDDEEEVTGAE